MASGDIGLWPSIWLYWFLIHFLNLFALGRVCNSRIFGLTLLFLIWWTGYLYPVFSQSTCSPKIRCLVCHILSCSLYLEEIMPLHTFNYIHLIQEMSQYELRDRLQRSPMMCLLSNAFLFFFDSLACLLSIWWVRNPRMSGLTSSLVSYFMVDWVPGSSVVWNILLTKDMMLGVPHIVTVISCRKWLIPKLLVR